MAFGKSFIFILFIAAILIGLVFFRSIFLKYSILVALLAFAYVIIAYGVTKYQEG